MENRNKPSFLVVGAAKSGTTSLFQYLNQHPKVFIPEVKECRFFSQLPKNFNGLGAEFFPNTGITDKQEYFKLFSDQSQYVCGDISNDYLYYHQRSIKNIKKYLSDEVKIIILLRNPIDRAYSNYLHAYRDGWENLSFEKAIIAEVSRMKDNWAWPYHYINAGFYYSQVKSYMESFKNIKVFLYDELKDIDVFMSKVYDFLGLDEVNLPNRDVVYNSSGYPKNKFIHKIVNNNGKLKDAFRPIIKKLLPDNFMINLKNNNLKNKSIQNETRLYLEKIYSDDIRKLSDLINVNLRYWLRNGL